MAEKITTHIDL
jgi:hypothetical protein